MRQLAEIRRLFAGAVVTLLLACAAVALTPAAPAHAAGSVYYVDCSAASTGTGRLRRDCRKRERNELNFLCVHKSDRRHGRP